MGACPRLPVLQVSLTALREHMRSTLPDYMVPNALVQLESFPLTATGKLDRAALPKPEVFEQLEGEYSPPRTPIEEQLASIWSTVLGLKRVGIYDNFFELGGHSLLATRVISTARAGLGLDVPLRALFEAPTVAALAAYIDRTTQGISVSNAASLAATSERIRQQIDAMSDEKVGELLAQLEGQRPDPASGRL